MYVFTAMKAIEFKLMLNLSTVPRYAWQQGVPAQGRRARALGFDGHAGEAAVLKGAATASRKITDPTRRRAWWHELLPSGMLPSGVETIREMEGAGWPLNT